MLTSAAALSVKARWESFVKCTHKDITLNQVSGSANVQQGPELQFCALVPPHHGIVL